MHELTCGEVWGGISNHEDDVESVGLVATMFSASCDGGKGGDLYYLSQCQGGVTTRFAVADVVGHGEAVSHMSQWLYDSLQARMNTLDSNAVLEDINALACKRGIGAMTTAVIAGYYSPDSRLSLASAGHPPPLVWQEGRGMWSTIDTQRETTDGPANLPLGVLVDVPYIQSSLDLETGDRLLMYTDGLTEARAADRTQFGAHRLLEILNDVGPVPLPQVKSSILGALHEHTGGSMPDDDVTLLVVEIT